MIKIIIYTFFCVFILNTGNSSPYYGIDPYMTSPSYRSDYSSAYFFPKNELHDYEINEIRNIIQREYNISNGDMFFTLWRQGVVNLVFKNFNCNDEGRDVLIIQGHIKIKQPPSSNFDKHTIRCDYIHFMPNSSLESTSGLDVQIDKISSGQVLLVNWAHEFLKHGDKLSDRWKRTVKQRNASPQNGGSANPIKFSTKDVSRDMKLTIYSLGEDGKLGGDGGNGGRVHIELPEYFNENNLFINNEGGNGGTYLKGKGRGRKGSKGAVYINIPHNESKIVTNPMDI